MYKTNRSNQSIILLTDNDEHRLAGSRQALTALVRPSIRLGDVAHDEANVQSVQRPAELDPGCVVGGNGQLQGGRVDGQDDVPGVVGRNRQVDDLDVDGTARREPAFQTAQRHVVTHMFDQRRTVDADWKREREREREREMFYLTTHSTHFYLQLYGVRHMAKLLLWKRIFI